MALSELTDPAAVEATIAEFDQLGRDGFLKKYRFGPAKRYFLIHEGQRYDSKAIAGVAYGKQYPQRGQLKAGDFTGGEASVKARLEALGFVIEVGQASEPTRNPDWTREETILALDVYARRRPQLPGETDPDIVELSDLLRAYAQQRGVRGKETYSNPNGVSMKVSNLSRLDSGRGGVGLPHGSAIEERVWAEFMPEVAKLRAAAATIIQGIEGSSSPSLGDAEPPKDAATIDKPEPVSRGPSPSFGEVTYVREDGENLVYVMRLTGPVEPLFPKRHMHGTAVVKIGRSNDVKRRLAEMNSGFPPGLGLAWVALQTQTFPSGMQAHVIEQALLGELSRRGLTIGGEFAMVPIKEVETLLARAMSAHK